MSQTMYLHRYHFLNLLFLLVKFDCLLVFNDSVNLKHFFYKSNDINKFEITYNYWKHTLLKFINIFKI